MAIPGASQSWSRELKRFAQPSTATATWQLVSTIVPYGALMALMVLTMRGGLPYIATLLLAVPAAAFLVRLFVLFHDCVHGSFVASPPLRRWIGRVLGVLVFVPFGEWRHLHLAHHATSGDLSKRGTGDVTTLTVDEYAACSPLRRAIYRLYRNPLVMFGLGGIYFLLLAHRAPRRGSSVSRIKSVLYTNLAIAAVVMTASLTLGWRTYIGVQLPVAFIAGVVGVWLFYVQHNFNPSYWARPETWNAEDAALMGSSYYRLPKPMQWLTASIGLHHVHHLRPRIPSYALQRCLEATPELRRVPALTFWSSFRLLNLDLWDEQSGQYVSFRAAANVPSSVRERSASRSIP